MAKRNTQKSKGDMTYCSKECHAEGKRRRITAKNPNPKVDRISVSCHTCNKEILVVPSKFKKQDVFTCSWDCYQKRRENKGFNLLNKETKPERILREYLESIGVEFQVQKSIYPYWCDFYLPNQNLIIEVYGDYWHGNPSKFGYKNIDEKYYQLWKEDVSRVNKIISEGYRVDIFWEKEIYKNFHSIEIKIQNRLKENIYP